jgi:hypothetical protein
MWCKFLKSVVIDDTAFEQGLEYDLHPASVERWVRRGCAVGIDKPSKTKPDPAPDVETASVEPRQEDSVRKRGRPRKV